MKTYFVVAEMQNHIDKLKDSFVVRSESPNEAFKRAEQSLGERASEGDHWVIVKFERVE